MCIRTGDQQTEVTKINSQILFASIQMGLAGQVRDKAKLFIRGGTAINRSHVKSQLHKNIHMQESSLACLDHPQPWPGFCFDFYAEENMHVAWWRGPALSIEAECHKTEAAKPEPAGPGKEILPCLLSWPRDRFLARDHETRDQHLLKAQCLGPSGLESNCLQGVRAVVAAFPLRASVSLSKSHNSSQALWEAGN